jgi:hypothetical protein
VLTWRVCSRTVTLRTQLKIPGAALAGIGAVGLTTYFLGPTSVLDVEPRYALAGWIGLLSVGCIFWLAAVIPPRVEHAETGKCRDCQKPAPSLVRLEREGWTGAHGGGFLCARKAGL